MEKEKVNIGALIDEETERRLAIMEDPNYEWPQKAGKGDVIAIVVTIAVCALLIIGCMTGVIS